MKFIYYAIVIVKNWKEDIIYKFINLALLFHILFHIIGFVAWFP